MAVHALSSATVDLTVGGVWAITVSVRDGDRALVSDVPVVTVTLPNLTTVTPTVTTVTTGVYRAEYIPATTGRFLAAAVTTSHGRADFVAYVTAVTATADQPDIDDVKAYLGGEAASWTDNELTDALSTEMVAQRNTCNVPAAIPADLKTALMRRVAVNLARRRQMTDQARSGADVDLPPVSIYYRDPEVRRLEAPHRKLVMG